MIKIWAKIFKDNKMIKQTVFESNDVLDYGYLPTYVHDICLGMDIPSPVMLKTHIFNYAKYNYVKFVPEDFVEAVDFDKLVIENVNR